MKNLILLMALLTLSACSTVGRNTPEATPDKVLSRVDDLGERPNYIQESKPFRFENGMVISTGMTTIPASSRVEAAYRIAQNSAKAAIAGAIEQRLDFVFQNAEEGTTLDGTQVRYIGAEASKL